MARKTKKVEAELFSLYGFYVEVFFDEGQEPLFVYTFESIDRLMPYLKMINISDLFENTNK